MNPTSIRLTLPYPPTSNTLYTIAHGRKILSAAGRTYRDLVALTVMQQGSPKALEGIRLAVSLDVHPPDRRRRDIANTEKVVVDSCVRAGVISDDSLIDHLEITRRCVVRGGVVIMTVREWSGDVSKQEVQG